MPIFTPKSLTKSHLEEQQKLFKARDLQTLEKCALALELVGRLRKEGLEFIFKGGTSLMLLFDMPKRLSIDVDILCLEPLAKLNEVLDRVVTEAPFNRWSHQDHRNREAPPTKHFQVYYQPIVPSPREPSIQIDVIECESPYARLVEQPVQAQFLEIEEPISVQMPSACSLLGDKLATFAPSTIGYPYQPISRTGKEGEPRPIKVLKHLFDLGILAGIQTNMSETITTYGNVYKEQLKFRGSDITIDAALDDTQDAAFWVSRVGGRKLPKGEPKLDFMAKGINALGSHLLSEPFGRPESRLAAGRACLVAELVRQQAHDFDLSEFVNAPLNVDYLKNAQLETEWIDLNTIKGTNTEAFKYWEQTQRLRAKETSI